LSVNNPLPAATAEMLNDARWLPTSLEPATDTIALDFAQRDELASQAFLDARWVRNARHRRSASIRRIAQKSAPRLNFIWHTGFCCSTLLAKALDRRGSNLSLCEPQILVELARAKHVALAFGVEPTTLVNRVMGLLARRHSPEEAVTLKPSPAANFLLQEAIRATSGAMIFLYSDCRSFLLSIAKLGVEGRRYARGMLLLILDDRSIRIPWSFEQLMRLSDLEIAALVWQLQIGEFRRNWPLLDTGRAYSLDCDAFLDAPGNVLSRLARLFALDVAAEEVNGVVEGPLFRSNAKTGAQGYDADVRRSEHEHISRQIGPELDRIVSESYQRCGIVALGGPPLPNPLVEVEKDYRI
jgi:hypothetical protein